MCGRKLDDDVYDDLDTSGVPLTIFQAFREVI
jgi:hypothetical protein